MLITLLSRPPNGRLNNNLTKVRFERRRSKGFRQNNRVLLTLTYMNVDLPRTKSISNTLEAHMNGHASRRAKRVLSQRYGPLDIFENPYG